MNDLPDNFDPLGAGVLDAPDNREIFKTQAQLLEEARLTRIAKEKNLQNRVGLSKTVFREGKHISTEFIPPQPLEK